MLVCKPLFDTLLTTPVKPEQEARNSELFGILKKYYFLYKNDLVGIENLSSQDKVNAFLSDQVSERAILID